MKIVPLREPAADNQPEPVQPEQSTVAPLESDPIKTLQIKPLVIEKLSTVYDPEIPVNIYELGLIYDIVVDSAGVVAIRMTLTAPGCPAAQSLPLEIDAKVREISGVTDVKVEVVWDPPWDRDKMSDTAKLQLGMF